MLIRLRRVMPVFAPGRLASMAVLCVSLFVFLRVGGNAHAASRAYVTTGAEPWSSSSNTSAMNTAFGAGNWDARNYTSGAAIFTSGYTFIFLEGSDSLAQELAAFISSNQTAMENWVTAGGALFINAAPNEGSSFSMGFGVTLTYPNASGTGTAVNTGHTIFSSPNGSAGTSWTGSSFSHASVSGSGITSLITGASGQIILAERTWGTGRVLFGGMTTPNFHSPQPQASNLRANILSYTASGAVTNTAPTISTISNQTTNEDTATSAISFTIGDAQTAATSLTVTRASSNTTLIPTTNIVLGGSGSSRTVTLTPAANQNGTATITITVSDGTLSTSTQFLLTVTAVNDAPIFDTISNQTVNEDVAATNVTLTGVGAGGGTDESSQVVTLTATSGNPTIIPNPVVTGSGTTRTLTFTPGPNANGIVTITVTATDNGSGVSPNVNTFQRTFTITVTAVNDIPVANGQSVNTSEDTIATITLTGSDVETASLTFALSSLPTNGTVLLSGSTATYVPNKDFFGSDSFTFTVSDGSFTSPAATVGIAVQAVNDAPILTTYMADFESGSRGAEWNTGVVSTTPTSGRKFLGASGSTSGAEFSNQTVSLSLDSLPTHSTVTVQYDVYVIKSWDGNQTGGIGPDFFSTSVAGGSTLLNTTTFSVWPAYIQSHPGSYASTFYAHSGSYERNSLGYVWDGANPSLDAVYRFTHTFAHSASSIQLNFSASGLQGNTDESWGLDNVSVAVGSSLTTQEDTPVSATFQTFDAENDALTLAVASTPANGQVTVNGSTVTYTPNANYSGADSFSITANDGMTDSNILPISVTVTAVDNAPVFDVIENQTVDEDASATTLTITGVGAGGGTDETAQTVTLVATSGDTSLIPHPVITGDGSTRTLAFTPAANMNGTATISVVATDTGSGVTPNVNTFERTFTITVNALNDAPAFDAISAQTVNEDAPETNVTITGVNAGGAPDETVQTVMLTATSDTPSVVPNPTITGEGGTRTLTFTPIANATGSATITVRASDDGSGISPHVNTTTQTFIITVTPVNDAPVFDAIENQTVSENASATSLTITGVGSGGGTDEAAQTVTLTAVSGDTSAIPHPTITGTGSARTLTFQPIPGRSVLEARITVTATDDGLGETPNINTFSRQFTITVTDVPATAENFGETVAEDAAEGIVIYIEGSNLSLTGDITFTVSTNANTNGQVDTDIETPVIQTTPIVLATRSGTTIEPAHVAYYPAADFNGEATFTYTVADENGVSAPATVTVTVTPVNDAPTVTAPSVGGPTDPDVTLFHGGAPITVTLTNVTPGPANESDQTVTVTAMSQDAGVVQVVSVMGSESSRTLTLQAIGAGTATVTVTVTDTGLGDSPNVNTFTTDFLVEVIPVVDASLTVSALFGTVETQTVSLGLSDNGAVSDAAHIEQEDVAESANGTGNLGVVFERADGFAAAQRLTRDVVSKPIGSDPRMWVLKIRSAVAPADGTASISWSPTTIATLLAFCGSGDYDLALLTDRVTGRIYDLLQSANTPISFAPDASGDYVFDLTLDKSDAVSVPFNFASEGYHLISLPGVVDAANAGHLNGVSAFSWDAASQAYVPISATNVQNSLTPMTQGVFFYAMEPGTTTLTLNQDAMAARSAEVLDGIQPGWNLIGAPASLPGAIPASVVTDGNANTLFAYVNGEYVPAATLEAGKGYWLLNLGSQRNLRIMQLRHMLVEEEQFASPAIQPEWSFPLVLEGTNGSTRRVEIGAAAQSTASFDRFDIPLPPTPPVAEETEFWAQIDHLASRLSRSVQPLSEEATEWTLTARIPEHGATLRWNAPKMAQGWRLVMEVGGEVVDMTERHSVRLLPGERQMHVRMAWDAPATTRALPNYPNPFNPETWIPFELKESADVTVTIYNAAGQLVRRLELGRLDAGYYTSRSKAAYWDGRNTHGEQAASGVYFYELRSGSSRMLRRMLLVK